MFGLMQYWRLMSCTKARLPRLLNTIMQTLLANSSWSTKITGNADTLYARAHFAIWIWIPVSFVFNFMLHAIPCVQLQRRIWLHTRPCHGGLGYSFVRNHHWRIRCRWEYWPWSMQGDNYTKQHDDTGRGYHRSKIKCKVPSCNNYWPGNHVGNQNKHSFEVYVWPEPSTK